MSYNVKGTTKQKRAVELLANSSMSMGKIMIEAGYKPNTAHCPVKLTESKGFIELCEQAGLTREMVLKALADDIKDKPRDRSKEIGQACKVLGLYKADNEQKIQPINIEDGEFIEIIRAYRPRIKA